MEGQQHGLVNSLRQSCGCDGPMLDSIIVWSRRRSNEVLQHATKRQVSAEPSTAVPCASRLTGTFAMLSCVSMSVIGAFTKLFRTILVLAMVSLFVFGSLTVPSFAEGPNGMSVVAHPTDNSEGVQYDHHAVASKEPCPAGHTADVHDMGDLACCTGLCVSMVLLDAVTITPAVRLTVLEPFYAPLSARTSVTELVRPPSLIV